MLDWIDISGQPFTPIGRLLSLSDATQGLGECGLVPASRRHRGIAAASVRQLSDVGWSDVGGPTDAAGPKCYGSAACVRPPAR